jgi:hypothetical protein
VELSNPQTLLARPLAALPPFHPRSMARGHKCCHGRAELRPSLSLPTLQATTAIVACTTDSAILSHTLTLAPRFARSTRTRSTERVHHCKGAEQPPSPLFLASDPPLLRPVVPSPSPRRAAPVEPFSPASVAPEHDRQQAAAAIAACFRGQHALGGRCPATHLCG